MKYTKKNILYIYLITTCSNPYTQNIFPTNQGPFSHTFYPLLTIVQLIYLEDFKEFLDREILKLTNNYEPRISNADFESAFQLLAISFNFD